MNFEDIDSTGDLEIVSEESQWQNFERLTAFIFEKNDFEVKVNPEFVRANDVKVLIGDKCILDAAVGEVDAIPLVETLGWMLV